MTLYIIIVKIIVCYLTLSLAISEVSLVKKILPVEIIGKHPYWHFFIAVSVINHQIRFNFSQLA